MSPEETPRPERVLESRRIYDGRVVSLRVDTVELASGRTARREVVEHGEVAAVVPLDGEGRVLLVQQYRLPAGRALLEVPAGGLDPGETPEEAAQRELREETGQRAAELRRLGGFYVSPGYCTEFIHVFLARGLSPSPRRGDDDEEIVVRRLPLAEALGLVYSGQITDAKSIVGLLLAAKVLNFTIE